MTTWNDISTAPRDGRDILLFFPLEGLNHDWSPQTIIGYWRSNINYWVFQNRAVRGYSEQYQPTHWMPLPDPPSA